MAEPTGWSWVGTRIQSNYIVVYDRGTSYGEYKLNPFTQEFVKTDGGEYDPDTSPDNWRFLLAYDGIVESSGNISANEISGTTADQGMFRTASLPWLVTAQDLGCTGESIGSGYDNTENALYAVDTSESHIWGLLYYWRNFLGNEWFIPSIDELNQIYFYKKYFVNLSKNLIHTGSSDVEGDYCIFSSTESTSDSTNQVTTINWTTGNEVDISKTSTGAKFTVCRYI